MELDRASDTSVVRTTPPGDEMTEDVRLAVEPMSTSRVDDYLKSVFDRYQQEAAATGLWSTGEARRLAGAAFAELFYAEPDSDRHRFFVLRDAETGEGVGAAWVRLGENPSVDDATFLDLYIRPGSRRRGYGELAMAEIERWLAGQGVRRVTANVFGGNSASLGLIASRGWKTGTVWAAKTLTGDGRRGGSGDAES